MREPGGSAPPAWEAFVSVFGHGTAVLPGQCEPPRACGRSRPALHPRAALVAGYLADARCLTQTSLAQRFRRGRHEAVSGRFPVIGADSPAWRLALSRLMTWSDRSTNRPAATLIKVR